MTDTTSTPRRVSVQPPAGDRFTGLVGRTAAGDCDAFRCLYAELAAPTWRAAATRLGCRDAASSVTDATFVEVWYRAKSFDATVQEGEGWIASIAARRCEDWLRAANLAGSRVVADSMADYNSHLQRELAAIQVIRILPQPVRHRARRRLYGALGRERRRAVTQHPQCASVRSLYAWRGEVARPLTGQPQLAAAGGHDVPKGAWVIGGQRSSPRLVSRRTDRLEDCLRTEPAAVG